MCCLFSAVDGAAQLWQSSPDEDIDVVSLDTYSSHSPSQGMCHCLTLSMLRQLSSKVGHKYF